MSEPLPGKSSEGNEPYSASKHAIQGAGENVHEAKQAVNKATDSIKDLVSGKGNIVDAAMAVKGAYDNVTGLTGRLSATAMMPVMKALSAFKGQAILPAGKQMDPVMGIDVHMVNIPPSPAPVPLPHPYIGILFNAKDWVSCLINTFKKAALDTLPPPAEDDKGVVASIAKNKDAIAGIAMGLAGMSASVKFGGIIPRAVTGTKTKNIPHIPMGAGFHAAFAASVAKNDGKAFLGSLFVVADGDPMVGSFHLNYDCWDVGVIDLFKSQRAGAKKAPEAGEPLAELFVPSGTVMPIPLGRPVLVNSIPTPVNPLAILDKLFKAGLGKLKAAGRKLAQKGLDKLNGKVGCGPLTAASKLVGTGQSHPVDVAGGHFYTDNIDFKLPGPIPFSWERTWYSYSDYKGPLGYGWHHTYDMALAIDNDAQKAIVRMSDGRVAHFELPAAGRDIYNRSEKLTLCLHAEGYYYITDKNGLIYRFTQKVVQNVFNQTETHVLQSVANRNGFAIRLTYNNDGLLTQITDSAGRILKVNNDGQGRIINIEAPDPRYQGRSTFAITSYTYTNAGDMATHADALNQAMHFEYQNHLMVKEIWRNGCNWHFKYDKLTGHDAKCIEVEGTGGVLHYKFDYTDPQYTLVTNSLGYKKKFYHKNGVVTKYIDPLDGEWNYQYNPFNELECKTDPLGNQLSFTYDKWGNRVAIIDARGSYDSTEYYLPKFPLLPTGAMDAAGGKWKWEYDDQGNLIARVNPAGVKTTYEYSDGLLVRVLNASVITAELKYDTYQNISKIQTDDSIVKEFDYDILGNCVAITNSNGIKQKRFFDLKNRIEKANDFDGNVINLTYDGIDNIIRYQDKQQDIKYTYTGLRKLASRTEGGASIYFSHDTEAQLRKIVNENGLSYTFDLDAAGNVTSEKGFDGILRTYKLNAAGWIIQVDKPAGKYTKYRYDAVGRVTEELYNDGKTKQFAYRQDGNLIMAKNETAVVKFELDVMGNILKESVNNEWIKSEYSKTGDRIEITSSIGANIVYKYNENGSVLQAEANGWLAKFEHDKLGLEINRFLPGGINSSWKRDGIGRPVIHEVGGTTNDHTTRQKRYQWDVNDRLQLINDNSEGITKFQYDLWGNLAKTVFADGELQLRNPDATGNLFKTELRDDRTYINGGRLTKAGGWKYNYDAEGNLIEKKHSSGTSWQYVWNNAGMLTRVTRPDKAEVTFGYDALGRRLWKQYKNTLTRFVWDNKVILHEWKENIVTGEKLSDTKVEADGIITWVFDIDTFVPAAKIKGDKQYSIIKDHIGTPCRMYKGSGELIWDCELDSYGKVRMEKGEPGSCPFRYQGQYEDRETELYYNRYRYYSYEDGIYISQDPIRLRGGKKFYSYVYDPNKLSDPLGLTCDDEEKLKEADAARDAEWEANNSRPARKRSTVVIGGFNTETGEVAAAGSSPGMHAEDNLVAKLGGDTSKVAKTTARRRATSDEPEGREMPICTDCEKTHGRDTFPPNAQFDSDAKKDE